MKKIINNKYYKFIILIVVFGLLMGILYYLFLNNNTKETLLESIKNINNFKYNFILKDLIIMSILLVLSFIMIVLPFGIIYILYESFSLGFLLSLFFNQYSVKGILFILIYIIIYKLFTLVLKISYLKKLLNISKSILKIVFNKKDEYVRNRLIINIKNCLYIFIIVFVVNTILYFLSPYIFSKISYLIK